MILLLICLVIKNLIQYYLNYLLEEKNMSLVFITQSYFAVPKTIRLNSTHYFVMKVPNKRALQQITFNHSSDIDFQDFVNRYKKCTAKLYCLFIY